MPNVSSVSHEFHKAFLINQAKHLRSRAGEKYIIVFILESAMKEERVYNNVQSLKEDTSCLMLRSSFED